MSTTALPAGTLTAPASIWNRLRALPGALEPEGLLALSDEALRGAGLSRPKVAHAQVLARAFLERALSIETLQALGDAEAIALIASIKGLGIWTAEIYLLFALQRLDVFPAGDIALAAAAADLKRLPARPDPKALRVLAEAWRPARSLAARLLWHHWRHLTGRPALDDFPSINGPLAITEPLAMGEPLAMSEPLAVGEPVAIGASRKIGG